MSDICLHICHNVHWKLLVWGSRWSYVKCHEWRSGLNAVSFILYSTMWSPCSLCLSHPQALTRRRHWSQWGWGLEVWERTWNWTWEHWSSGGRGGWRVGRQWGEECVRRMCGDLDLLYLSLLQEQRDYIQQSPRCSSSIKYNNIYIYRERGYIYIDK